MTQAIPMPNRQVVRDLLQRVADIRNERVDIDAAVDGAMEVIGCVPATGRPIGYIDLDKLLQVLEVQFTERRI